MEGASEGAATLGAAALGDPADEAHAATTSGMIRIEYRIRIAIVLLCRPALARAARWRSTSSGGGDEVVCWAASAALGGNSVDHHGSRRKSKRQRLHYVRAASQGERAACNTRATSLLRADRRELAGHQAPVGDVTSGRMA